MAREPNLFERIVIARWLEDEDTLERIRGASDDELFEDIEDIAVETVLETHGITDVEWDDDVPVAAALVFMDFEAIEEVGPRTDPSYEPLKFPFEAASATWGQWTFPGVDSYCVAKVPGHDLLAFVVCGSQGWDCAIALDWCDPRSVDLAEWVGSQIESWWCVATPNGDDAELPRPTSSKGSALIADELIRSWVDEHWPGEDDIPSVPDSGGEEDEACDEGAEA